MGTGDGGGGGDPFRTGQNLQELRGKILRIDPRQNGADPYTVPANNPFVGQAPWKPEIWAYGVRNPWRFSFDRVTGDFTLGDVGQNTWEEIDYRPISEGWGRGVNFGWSCMEGRHLYGNCPEPPNHTPPVYEYNHNIGGCSITGGYVGRDQEVPSLLGRYVYADYCADKIWSNVLGIPDATDNREETDIPIVSPTSFGEDACGHMYVMGQGSGNNVFRIRQQDPPAPFCTPQYDLPVLTAQRQRRLHDPSAVQRRGARRTDRCRRAPTGSSSTTTRRSTTSICLRRMAECSLLFAETELCVGRREHRSRNLDGQLHDWWGNGDVPVRPPFASDARHVQHRRTSATAATATTTATAAASAASATAASAAAASAASASASAAATAAATATTADHHLPRGESAVSSRA